MKATVSTKTPLSEAARTAFPDDHTSFSRINQFIKSVGDIPVSSVTQQMVDIYHARRGSAPATVNRFTSTLARLGIKLKRVSVPEPPPKVLTEAQLALLDEQVDALASPTLSIIYALARDAGCRGYSEWSRIRRSDVDLEGGILTLRSNKGGRGEVQRIVPLSERLEEAMTLWKALVWCRLPGDTPWRAFWHRIRVTDHPPYVLRHTFCTRLLERGVPEAVVCHIMGHSSIRTTMRYSHMTPTALDGVRKALR